MNKAEIDSLLKSPMKHSDMLTKLSSDRSDPVARHPFRNELSFRPHHIEPREDHVQKRLGHITSNPSDPENTSAIKDSYVFSSNRAIEEQADSENFVNRSSKAVDTFVDQVVTEANFQWQLSKQTAKGGADLNHLSQRTFIVHGPRGSGKTFFLNYILAQYIDKLDRQSVIWVRLDLVKDFPPNNDLLSWIYAQISKIVYRYYHSKSRLYRISNIDIAKRGLDQYLRDYVSRMESQEARLNLTNTLENMKNVFWRKTAEQPLDERLVPRVIGAAVYSYLLLKGFRFVVVLDGFDKLESTRSAIRKFEKLCGDSASLGLSTDLVGFVLLAVMRTSTLESFSRTSPYKKVESVRTFEIGPSDLVEIVSQRRAFLISEVARLAPSKKWMTSDWPLHFDGFVEFLERSETSEHYAAALHRAFGPNRRAQMQTIQLAYYDYIMSVRKQVGVLAPYKIVESMTKGGFKYPQKYYYYSTNAGKFTQRIADIPLFDNRLIPSIFDYPYDDSAFGGKFVNTGNEIALTLRIIQLVRAIEAKREVIKNYQPVSVAEICYILWRLFGYNEEILRWKIIELAESDVISLYGEYFQFDRELMRMRVRPLPKLVYILDKYVKDIAYLSLALMRAPIGPFVVEGNLEKVAPFVMIESYEPGDLNLINWITAKFVNSVSSVRILNEVNFRQESQVKKSLSAVNVKKGRYMELANIFLASGPFRLIESIREEVSRELYSLIHAPVSIGARTITPAGEADFVNVLERYSTVWGR